MEWHDTQNSNELVPSMTTLAVTKNTMVPKDPTTSANLTPLFFNHLSTVVLLPIAHLAPLMPAHLIIFIDKKKAAFPFPPEEKSCTSRYLKA